MIGTPNVPKRLMPYARTVAWSRSSYRPGVLISMLTVNGSYARSRRRPWSRWSYWGNAPCIRRSTSTWPMIMPSGILKAWPTSSWPQNQALAATAVRSGAASASVDCCVTIIGTRHAPALVFNLTGQPRQALMPALGGSPLGRVHAHDILLQPLILPLQHHRKLPVLAHLLGRPTPRHREVQASLQGIPGRERSRAQRFLPQHSGDLPVGCWRQARIARRAEA